jgi:hypothetical protein
MATRRYTIEPHAATRWRRPYWSVDVDGEIDGDFPSQRAALSMAIDAAQLDGLRGIAAEVVVRSERDGNTVVWVFGRDAYPPRFPSG